MQTIIFNKTNEVRKNKSILEKELKVRIKIKGKSVVISGKAIEEYEASLILEAINFGFSAKKSLKIKDEEVTFRVLNIKNIVNKKNLRIVRARIIGSKGKTKKTIEGITNTDILIRNNEIGIIGDAESVEKTSLAIISLIRGTKQSNAYRYLEGINRRNQKLK